MIFCQPLKKFYCRMYFLKSFCCILLFALLPGNVILAQQSYQHEALKAQHEGDTAKWIKALKFYGDSLNEVGIYSKSDSVLLQAVSLAVVTADRYETGILYNSGRASRMYNPRRKRPFLRCQESTARPQRP